MSPKRSQYIRTLLRGIHGSGTLHVDYGAGLWIREAAPLRPALAGRMLGGQERTANYVTTATGCQQSHDWETAQIWNNYTKHTRIPEHLAQLLSLFIFHTHNFWARFRATPTCVRRGTEENLVTEPGADFHMLFVAPRVLCMNTIARSGKGRQQRISGGKKCQDVSRTLLAAQ